MGVAVKVSEEMGNTMTEVGAATTEVGVPVGMGAGAPVPSSPQAATARIMIAAPAHEIGFK